MSICPPPCTCHLREHACSPPCKAHPELGGGLGNPGTAPIAIAISTRPQDWAEPARTILFGKAARERKR